MVLFWHSVLDLLKNFIFCSLHLCFFWMLYLFLRANKLKKLFFKLLFAHLQSFLKNENFLNLLLCDWDATGTPDYYILVSLIFSTIKYTFHNKPDLFGATLVLSVKCTYVLLVGRGQFIQEVWGWTLKRIRTEPLCCFPWASAGWRS